MKQILISLGLWCLLLIYCTLDKDNPFDINSNTYVPPTLTVDWDSTNITQNGTLTIDSLHIRLIGNTPQNEFRHCIDSGNWSGWTSSSIIINRNIENGNYTIYLQTRYPNGTDIYTDSINFEVAIIEDTEKPVITLLSPSDNTITTDPLLEITFKATDSSGVASVTVNDCTVTSSDSIYIDTVILKDDTNTITIIAIDASPNSNRDTLEATFIYDPSYVDSVPPSIKLLFPADSSISSDASLEVKFVITDISGIFEVTINNNTVISIDSIYTDTVELLDSINTVTVIAVDGSINRNSDTAFATFFYDSTYNDDIGPTITLVSPGDSSFIKDSTEEIEVNVDDISGVAWVTIDGDTVLPSLGNYKKTVSLTPGYNPIKIVAQDNATNKNLDTLVVMIIYDNVNPSLRLLDPAIDSSSIGGSSIRVEAVAKDNFSIKEVVFSVGTTIYPTTHFDDTTYYADITDLVQNVFTKIDIQATDTVENSTGISAYVKYDTTLNDEQPPAFTQTGGPVHDSRITTPQHTFSFDITDDNGVDSAYYFVDSVFKGNLTNISGDQYECTYDFVTSYGQHTVEIYAIDGSVNHNEGTKLIRVTYNTVIGAVTNTAPVNGAADIALLPVYEWSGGDDPDGDKVTYKVYYGTSSGSLTEEIDADTNKTVQSTVPLNTNIIYYWKVTAYSATYPVDSISSSITNFNTILPIDTHTVTFVAGTNGSIIGTATQRIPDGGNCSPVTADPDANYHFDSWTGDHTGNENPLTITNVTSDMTITANFAINTYTLTVTSDDSGSTTPSGDSTVNHGVVTPISATANSLCEFVDWEVTVGTASIANTGNPSTTVILTSGDATVRANFRWLGFYKTYGSDDTEGYCVRQTNDGGFIVTGGRQKVYLLKTDSEGTTSWAYEFEETGAFLIGKSVQQTSDNGYIIVGEARVSTFYGCVFVKTDASGLNPTQKLFPPTSDNWSNTYGAWSVQEISSGSYIVGGGWKDSITSGDGYGLLRLNSSQDAVWTKQYISRDAPFNAIKNVDIMPNGNLVAVGSQEYAASGYEMFLVIAETDGDVVDSVHFGGGTTEEYGYSVQALSNTEFIAVGKRGNYPNSDIAIYRVNSSGTVLDYNIFSEFTGDDYGWDVQKTSDGGYIIAAELGGDACLIKTNSALDKTWSKTYDHLGYIDAARSVRQMSDGGYVIAGKVGLADNKKRILLIRTNPSGDVVISR